ncbi:hypothetical protein I551_1280 [Mycobacterium ulcerans str. Harvey]|uniref:Uncharacterized protein n=1 Tax=Mycobacterium ulcerans str. Harvey TaxID=1299332 RepID=A0ABP3AMI8_MYCUL|nr:hypothetical protein I551_1280 [Mycobacterium ulcerans str. Harvey]
MRNNASDESANDLELARSYPALIRSAELAAPCIVGSWMPGSPELLQLDNAAAAIVAATTAPSAPGLRRC